MIFLKWRNLDTGAGGGDFWRLLSLWLVGRGMPELFNALLIAFSSSTLAKITMVTLVHHR